MVRPVIAPAICVNAPQFLFKNRINRDQPDSAAFVSPLIFCSSVLASLRAAVSDFHCLLPRSTVPLSSSLLISLIVSFNCLGPAADISSRALFIPVRRFRIIPSFFSCFSISLFAAWIALESRGSISFRSFFNSLTFLSNLSISFVACSELSRIFVV